MARLLVIQHEENCPADLFGRWWEADGAELTVVYGPRETVPESTEGYDALVVLGGGMNCSADEANPHLAPTRALIKRAVGEGVPFLGICLGLQLASVALGGEVGRKAEVSLGLVPVALTDAGRVDELLGGVEPGALAIQYNFDHVTRVPDGAVVLASAPDGHVQALRFADRAWGVQFHPEASAATFRAWTTDKPAEKRPAAPGGASLDEVAAAVEGAEQLLEQAWRPLAARFLAVASVNDAAAVTAAVPVDAAPVEPPLTAQP